MAEIVNEDMMALPACAALDHLVERSGGAMLEISSGPLDDIPADIRAGLRDVGVDLPESGDVWAACATYMYRGRPHGIHGIGASPEAAATDLARTMFNRAACRCGRRATCDAPPADGACLWEMRGEGRDTRWVPTCDAPSLTVRGRSIDVVEERFVAAHGRTIRDVIDGA